MIEEVLQQFLPNLLFRRLDTFESVFPEDGGMGFALCHPGEVEDGVHRAHLDRGGCSYALRGGGGIVGFPLPVKLGLMRGGVDTLM